MKYAEIKGLVIAVCGAEIGPTLYQTLIGDRFGAVSIEDIRMLEEAEWRRLAYEFGSEPVSNLRNRLSYNSAGSGGRDSAAFTAGRTAPDRESNDSVFGRG